MVRLRKDGRDVHRAFAVDEARTSAVEDIDCQAELAYGGPKADVV